MSSRCENCKCNSEIEVCADCDWRTKRFKIPRFATNGDVIKALFPDVEFCDDMNNYFVCMYHDIGGTHNRLEMPMSWWNAPYRKEVNKMTKE